MKTLKATFQIVTPMFIGGANQTVDDGIRPPSVKGVLRFWWRALNWGRLRSQASCDEAALALLHAEENRLFGATASDNSGGQGCFLLTVMHEPLSQRKPPIPRFTGKAYLAGMGLDKREALQPGEDFTIILVFRPLADQTAQENVMDVLRLLGLLGGIGSRNRRGFGSIVRLVQDNDRSRLPTQNEFEQNCNWLKSKLADYAQTTSSPFSALNAETLFCRSDSDYSSWDEAMENVGKIMNRYRTNGTSAIKNRDGAILDTAPADHRIVGGIGKYVRISPTNFPFFATDHNRVHAIASTSTVASPNDVPPNRSIFGLPHPYRFSSLNGTKVSFDFVPSWTADNTKGRRASPLFVHIAAFTNEQGRARYRPLLLLLPARFLPVNAQLDVSVHSSHVGDIPAPTDYTPIQNFLTTYFTSC